MERPIRTIIDEHQPVTANPDTTVRDATQLMKQHRVGALLVVDHGRLAGIFTERDAVFRVLADKRNPDSTRLRDVMTRNPRTISPDRPFGHALHLMWEGEFRHVPVTENGRPVGLVSSRDALVPELQQFAFDMDERVHIGEILG